LPYALQDLPTQTGAPTVQMMHEMPPLPAPQMPQLCNKRDKTVIVLADDTENILTDSENNKETATILSKDDLTICGTGSHPTF